MKAAKRRSRNSRSSFSPCDTQGFYAPRCRGEHSMSRPFPVVLGSIAAVSLAVVAGCRTVPAERGRASETHRAPEGGAKQEASLPQQIADVMVQLNGGIHTGFRFAHAKGVVATGTFTPAPTAKSISSAAHLQGGPVPVTVRFSDGTGESTDPRRQPQRGTSRHGRKVHASGRLYRHRRSLAQRLFRGDRRGLPGVPQGDRGDHPAKPASLAHRVVP